MYSFLLANVQPRDSQFESTWRAKDAGLTRSSVGITGLLPSWRQLYISVNTLKTHVRAIYRKLDVPHRSAAVHRATALQLV